MSGTKEGGKKAAITNRQIYGDNYYAKIGRKGGAERKDRWFCIRQGR